MVVKIYKIDSAKISSIRQVLSADHWARNGYTLRAGRGLGIDTPDYFLYVKSEEVFFTNHEAEVLIEGVTTVEGTEFESIKKAVETEEDSVASGIALFG